MHILRNTKTLAMIGIILLLLLISGCTPVDPSPVTSVPQGITPSLPVDLATPTQASSPAAVEVPEQNLSTKSTGQMPVDPNPNVPMIAPPASQLHVDDQTQIAGIGTYCWSEPQKNPTMPGVCMDMIGIPTALEPLQVSSPVHLQFELPVKETPAELVLTVHTVDASDEQHEAPSNYRWWAFKPGEAHNLELSSQPSSDLTLHPGLYVLDLFARWENGNDVSYGFLVQVK